MKHLASVITAAMLALSAGSALAQPTIDLTRSNAASRVVIPAIGAPLNGTWAPGDASLIFRALTLMSNGWFDAIAPYHATAVGVHSNIPRRPVDEHTDYNRNVALLYATLRINSLTMPLYVNTWRKMLSDVGLNPDDTSTDLATPVGIGNAAAAAIIANRMHVDGFNQRGDAGGCVYNCRPYADHTGYVPVNSAQQLVDPARWQPLMRSIGNGIFTAQQFVTPGYGLAMPYSYPDVSAYLMPPPPSPHTDLPAFKAEVDAVIAASAALTDEKKMKVEYFDNKYVGYTTPVRLADRLRLPLSSWVHYYFVSHLAGYDVGLATWYNKRYYEYARPQSSVGWLYGNTPITAWGGPGKGTVNDLPARQWVSYAPTANHPDYPSGSSAFCAAFAETSRQWLGTDDLRVVKNYAVGSSVNEPGVTPQAPLTLNYQTWTQWETDCRQSRVDAGVHFPVAVHNTWTIGYPISAAAVNFVRAHVDGNPPAMRYVRPQMKGAKNRRAG